MDDFIQRYSGLTFCLASLIQFYFISPPKRARAQQFMVPSLFFRAYMIDLTSSNHLDLFLPFLPLE